MATLIILSVVITMAVVKRNQTSRGFPRNPQ